MTRKPRSAFSVDTKSPNHSPSPDRYREVGLCESIVELLVPACSEVEPRTTTGAISRLWEITLQGIADLETLSGPVTPVLAKYSKSFSLIDRISLGIDRMQRNFEPMHKQVEAW